MLATLPTVSASEKASLEQALRSSVWRASDLAVSRATTMQSGYCDLDKELPNGGWPRSALVELLVQQHGIGEMQLLKPMLAALSQQQRVALIQPPYLPHLMTCRAWQLNERNILWLKPQSSSDALWCTEQFLKNACFGIVILWQSNTRPEALRRLNLAAQSTDTWLWLVRPLAAAADASPSPLRIALRPALGGISADIIKRRGPHSESPIYIPLADMPVHQLGVDQNEAPIHRVHTASIARVSTPALV